jgi:hypothetical protein
MVKTTVYVDLFFDMGAVTAEAFTDTGCSVLSIRLPEKEWQRLQHQH